MGVAIDLAVAAKGTFDTAAFFEAIAGAGLTEFEDVTVFIAHDQPWPGPFSHPLATIQLCPTTGDVSLPKVWAQAILAGRSSYVAILDIRCPPRVDWWLRLAEAIKSDRAAFFGPVEPGWDRSDPRITGYLIEYAQFAAPLPDWLIEVPGNNVVFRRELLPAVEVLQRNGFSKTFLVWTLARERRLRVEPVAGMEVSYRKGFSTWRYVVGRYRHGRCFAGSRHVHPGQPPRWLCLMTTPVLPALRLARIARACWRRADLRLALATHMLPVIASEIAWSAGEFAGYAFGPGKACENLD